MSLKIIEHARERMYERGATEKEIKKVLRSGKSAKAKADRKAKEALFPFNNYWQGKFYEQKKIKTVYVEEKNNLVVITVYVYYGKWEENHENLL